MRLCNRFTHKLSRRNAQASVSKGQQIRAFCRKTKSGKAKGGGGGEDVEIEQHGVAHVVTQKLRISYTKGARVFFFVVQTAEKVTPCRGQFTVCCTWQSRLSTTMPSERSSVSAGGQQEFTRKALQHLTVHRMQKTIETREPWKTLAGPLVTESKEKHPCARMSGDFSEEIQQLHRSQSSFFIHCRSANTSYHIQFRVKVVHSAQL